MKKGRSKEILLVLISLLISLMILETKSNAAEVFTYTDPESGAQYNYNVDEAGNVTDLRCTNTDAISGEIKIPEKIDDKNVVSIRYDAFNKANGITNVIVPNTITKMGGNSLSSGGVFYSCKGLRSITLSENITTIYEKTFEECIGLTTITLPKKITTIEHSAFKNCKSLKDINFSDNITTIGRDAFYGCNSLTTVTLPEKLTYIDSGFFAGCDNLIKVVIPKTVSGIADTAFNGSENVVIYGYKGTTAEEYATQKGIKFVDIESNEAKEPTTSGTEQNPTNKENTTPLNNGASGNQEQTGTTPQSDSLGTNSGTKINNSSIVTSKDGTVANTILPNTGKNMIIGIIAVGIISSVILLNKYNKYKEIK